MNKLILAFLTTAVMSLLGCGEGTAPTPTETPTTASVETVGDGGELIHPELERPPQSRHIKRLTVAMLAGSIPVVAGDDENGEPVTWKMGNQEALGNDTHFGRFDRTLGRPDYVAVTNELTEPSALYVKFMGDMSRDVCDRTLKSDMGKAPEARTITRFAPLGGPVETEDLRANLRYLKLRFWGEYVPEGAEHDAQIADLEEVFESVKSAGADTRSAWNAVCVTLLSSPAFHLY